MAKMVSGHKGNDNVALMFAKAKAVAGKVSEKLISDGAANFGHAHKKQYAAKNFLHKDSEHVKHIHMAGYTNSNQMESFNGNTVRHREKVVRGLKTDDSAILTGLRIYHNHVRPHLGLPDGQTSGEAAGIRIEENSKWKTAPKLWIMIKSNQPVRFRSPKMNSALLCRFSISHNYSQMTMEYL